MIYSRTDDATKGKSTCLPPIQKRVQGGGSWMMEQMTEGALEHPYE